jgi:hypothetical protein
MNNKAETVNIINIDNYDKELENIILSKKISNDTSAKYNIYSYKNDRLQNVLLSVPPIRLIYGYSNQIYNQINFPLNPTYPKTKSFVKLISNLENKLQELLNKPKLEWITNLKKIKNVKSIKLNYYGKKNVKIISKDIGITDIKDFSADSEVEIMVHLSHLWIKDNKVGISYNITHVKYNSLQDMLDFDIFEKEVNKPKLRSEPIIPRSGSETNKFRSETNNQRSMSMFIPSKEMLNLQKNNLKSIN